MEIVQDQNWSKFVGKIYYVICPDDNRYFRSIRIAHNTWTNGIKPQISNPIMGIPPEEMEPIPELMLTRLLKHQTSSAFC